MHNLHTHMHVPTLPLPPRAPLQIRADIPETNYGSNVEIKFSVPKNTATVTPELGPGAGAPPTRALAAVATASAGAAQTQVVEYVQKDREVVWRIKRFQGQTEHVLRTRITLGSPSTSNIRKEVGPISMSFEIPMYNTSNLQVSERTQCVMGMTAVATSVCLCAAALTRVWLF